MAHHAHNALYDVVDVGEVTLAVAVIEDLNILVAHQFVGEAEVCHVGTAGRTVDGKKAKACTGDIVEFTVSVRHQLVALLRGGIEAHGICLLCHPWNRAHSCCCRRRCCSCDQNGLAAQIYIIFQHKANLF